MYQTAVAEGAQPIDVGPVDVPVYVQVTGAGQVRFGDNPQVLQQYPNDGIPFVAASNPLPSCMFWWHGLLYYIGNISVQAGGVPFSINFPQGVRQGQRAG